MKINAYAEQLGQFLLKQDWRLATAESCTGGMVAAAVTDIAGSSGWFDRGFVTYSNEAKQQMLGVENKILEQHGAVSEETALAMAKGALAHANAQVSLAITGIAGPAGGTLEKPVGTVWFAWGSLQQAPTSLCKIFPGDRHQIREAARDFALQQLIKYLQV